MSWLYLPELVGDYSHLNGYSDGELSATLKMQPIPSKYSKLEYAMDYWTTLQSGMTLEHSTGNRGVDAWILSLRDSHANRSALQDNSKPQTMNEMDGLTPFALLEKSDQDTAYWRMYQDCLPLLMDTLAQYSETWPKAGMMQDGVCYLLQKWERRINAIGSGLLPTITKEDASRKGSSEGWKAYENGKQTSQWRLRNFVQMWPTPKARDYRVEYHTPGVVKRESPDLNKVIGGKLNPRWVEWLMGWPIGWASLKPLEMDKFQSWLRSFGNCSQDR